MNENGERGGGGRVGVWVGRWIGHKKITMFLKFYL